MKHYDWMLQVMWQVLTNQSTLLQRRVVSLQSRVVSLQSRVVSLHSRVVYLLWNVYIRFSPGSESKGAVNKKYPLSVMHYLNLIHVMFWPYLLNDTTTMAIKTSRVFYPKPHHDDITCELFARICRLIKNTILLGKYLSQILQRSNAWMPERRENASHL